LDPRSQEKNSFTTKPIVEVAAEYQLCVWVEPKISKPYREFPNRLCPGEIVSCCLNLNTMQFAGQGANQPYTREKNPNF